MFNLKQDVSIELNEAIALTIKTGRPVYMTESGRLASRKPISNAVRILEPINLMDRGVEFRKFTAAEDYIGEHGGWGFRYQGQTLCFGHDSDDKEYASQYIAGDLDDNLFSDIRSRLLDLEDTLMTISRHSYDEHDDWAHATADTDIAGLLASLQ